MESDKQSHFFDEIVDIIERLRAPGGCPWDRKQKLGDLRTYIVEEAYELTEAITEENMDKIREESGDLLLQIVFVASIAAEKGAFNIRDVVKTVCEKLVRRHPHVFGDVNVSDSDEVLRNWERIKLEERKNNHENLSILSGIPKGLPPLLKAHRIQGKVSHVGFDWPENNIEPLFDKLDEEVTELKEAVVSAKTEAIEDELGDVLFMTVNLARHLKINPDAALTKACQKFSTRFEAVEQAVAKQGRQMNECSPEELDALWRQAKQSI